VPFSLYRIVRISRITPKIALDAERNGLPIPFTGKRGRYCYFRHPRNINFRRADEASQADMAAEGFFARVEKKNQPPTNWDDIGRADVDHRSWKRHRKHQWRG